MSERRSGLLLVGPDKLAPTTFGEYQRRFEADGVTVQHPFKLDHLPSMRDFRVDDSEEARHAVAIEYSRSTRALQPEREHGQRLLKEHLGRIAARAAALLVLNIQPDGDIQPRQGDFTQHEWAQLMEHDNPEGLFFINTIPHGSDYASYTVGENSILSPRVIGGRLEVVTNKIYEVEGRRRGRKR